MGFQYFSGTKAPHTSLTRQRRDRFPFAGVSGWCLSGQSRMSIEEKGASKSPAVAPLASPSHQSRKQRDHH